MNSREKEVIQAGLTDEKHTIKQLERIYDQARKDCEAKIAELNARTDLQNIQSIVYQRQYQEALKKQLDGVLDTLHGNQFTTVADYLGKCYENGFYGTLYDLQGQGVPLIFPMRQDQVVKALEIDSKLSKPLYKKMGEDVDYLKKSIRAELSRGVASGSSYLEMATHIANGMNSPFNKAMNRAFLITRTEGHRVQEQAAMDVRFKARDAGADILKEWVATLDDKTREWHADADGQIRELDEMFDVNGEQMEAPGIGGSAENVCNCRCFCAQCARWALGADETRYLADVDEMTEDQKEQIAKKLGIPVDELPQHSKSIVKIRSEDYDDFKVKTKDAIQKQSSDLYPDSLAGIKRGSPMTFDEADTGKVNPKYGTRGGYSINCQSCVPTFEARQRGYDVQVLPNTPNSTPQRLSRKTNLIWIDPATGDHPKYLFDDSATTPKKYLGFVQNTVEQGGRYSIEFAWKGRRRSGHIVNLDRTESGELRIKDNQRGNGERSEWVGDAEVLKYLGQMKYTATVYGNKFSCVPKILRIDNMKFDEDIAKGIMEGFGK